jgi:hypothetical protein
VKNTAKMLLAAACCLTVIVFAGCASLSPTPATQETLEERVRQYMQAQIDGNWDLAYSFYDSSSRREIRRESYISRPRKLSYKGFEIEEITGLPSGDQATVKVKIDLLYMGYNFKGAPQTQEWVKEKGAWFVNSRSQSRKTPFNTQENKP